MNSDSPIFDDRRPPASGGGGRFMVILLVLLGLLVAAAGFLWFYQQAKIERAIARRLTSRNNLKMIGLALHNYHDVYKKFPPSAIVDEHGKPRHGWTYSILPFIDESPIFDRINSHAAWDTPANQTYSRTMVPIYLNPEIRADENPAGFGVSHYAGNAHLFQPNQSFQLSDVRDGWSNTLLVGEVNDGFEPWAKPPHTRDPALGLNKGPDTFGSPFEGGVHFVLVDGSVRFISDEIDPQVLKALATPDGGEKIEKEW